MLRSRLLALPALSLALVLTGCAGDGSSDRGTDPAPEAAATTGPAAADLVRTAAAETTETGSSKLSLTSTTVVGGQDVTFSGEGAFDYAEKTGQLSFEVPGADGSSAGGGSIEQRIIGPDLFLTLPQTPGVFYRLKVADVAGTSLGGSADPTASLQALEGLADVKEVGKEQVRGVETTHYEGTYDVKEAIAKAQGVAKTVLESTLASSDLEDVPFDAYLDGEGRLVKFEQELQLPATAQTGGQPLRSTTVLELFDFGTEVVVTAPPADKVRDGAPLLAALRSAVPQPRSSTAPSMAPTASPVVPSPPPPAASPVASPAS